MKARALLKVLVLNDNPKACNQFDRFLTKEGCKVYIANNGEYALETLKNITIDIVLLNIMITGGMRYFKYIKKTYPDIPVIMITGINDEKASMKLMESGAFAYLSKPINFEYLHSLLISGVLYSIKY
ncbi:MAG: response regulator [bacterium]|nr:response regulator [bacterium]